MPLACFLTPKPIGCTPQSCPTGSLPAAKAYFVTPPPLERHRKRPGFSGARHRRRPGGPGRYNATVVRACKVIPMRATQGAAAPMTKLPGKLAAMRGWFLPCPYSPPPPWAPVFWGVPGATPRPFLSHRFLWERKRCPGRAGPLREGGILYERATTGRPYGRRAESSRPTDSGDWAGIREPLLRHLLCKCHLPPTGGKASGG